MKTLKVFFILIVFLLSFNNQIFASEIDCDLQKMNKIVQEVAVTKFKDKDKIKELAGFSACGNDQIKSFYDKVKTMWKDYVDLEKYENKSVSKVAQKAKSDGKTENLAIECDITKFSGLLKEVAATKFKDEAKLEELASYSVCGAPVKTIYEKIKTSWKALVDLEKYEKKSGSKVAEKAVAEKAVPASESSKKSDGNIIKKGVVSSVVKCPSFLNLPHKGIEGGHFINKNFEGCDFSNAMMHKTTFENCNLKNTVWLKAAVMESTFINTNLEGATNLTDGRTFMLNKFINVNITDEFEDSVCTIEGNECSRAQLVADLSKKCEVPISKDSIMPVSQTVGQDGVDLIKFSNDGKLIAISYGDGTTTIFESSNGKRLFDLTSRSSSTMQSIVFTKDKKYIFGVNRNEFFKWSSRDGSLILKEKFFNQTKKSNDENKNFTLSSNGSLVAGSGHLDVDHNKKTEFQKKHNIKSYEDFFVYDVANNKMLFKSKCKPACQNFTFSRNNKLLAINSINAIDIYNVSNWKRVRQINMSKFKTNYLIEFKFNKKGDEIFAFYQIGQSQYFSRFSLRKNKIINTKLVFENTASKRTGKGIFPEIKFTEDGLYFAVISQNYDVQIWDYKKLEIIQSWKLDDNDNRKEFMMIAGHRTLAFSSNNLLAYGRKKLSGITNPGNFVKFWEVNLEERPEKIVEVNQDYGVPWTFAEFKYKNNPKEIKDVKSLKFNKLKILDDRYIVLEKEGEDKNLALDMFKSQLINYDEADEDLAINISADEVSIEEGLFNEIFKIELKKIWDVSIDINKKFVTILTGNDKNAVKIFDLATNKLIHDINISPATSVYYNGNGELYFGATSGAILKYKIVDSSINCTKVKHKSNIVKINYLKNGIYSSTDSNGLISIWHKNEKHLLDFYFFEGNQWVSLAKNGKFDHSTNFTGIHFVKNKEVITVDQFFDDFYTPGLLSQVYQTGELDETRNLDDALKQVIPTIEIIEPKKATTRGLLLAADDSSGCKVVSSQTRGFKKKKKKKKKAEEPGCGEDGTLRVVTKVTDQGGGFKDIVLYHNGKRLENVEGDIKSGPVQKGKTQLVTFRVPLAPGENYLRAEAKSLSRVRARPWKMVVDFEAPKPKGKPDLYLYVVGINKYSNPKFNLNYGRPDAEAVQKALGDNLKLGAFEKVHVSGIYDLEATKKNIAAQFLKFAKQARPRDVFVFYYAGHGRTLKDENGNPVFYLVSSNVGALDQDKTVKKGGLSGLELINYSKKIRAGKQMFLFDACESGSVAKAFARIQKDTGGHILYAAASNQLATEFESLGHGIFTYTLLKTLEDNKKLNVSLLSGGMDFLLEDLRPEFNLTNQTFGYYRTLEAPNFTIKSM